MLPPPWQAQKTLGPSHGAPVAAPPSVASHPASALSAARQASNDGNADAARGVQA